MYLFPMVLCNLKVHQFVMGAVFCYCAILHDEDSVGHADGGETVADENCRSPFCELVEL